MPYWVFECHGCKQKFKHSEIDESRLIVMMCPDKPHFPPTQFKCPMCELSAIYEPYQLIYSRFV
jgi:hypothetical protein